MNKNLIEAFNDLEDIHTEDVKLAEAKDNRKYITLYYDDLEVEYYSRETYGDGWNEPITCDTYETKVNYEFEVDASYVAEDVWGDLSDEEFKRIATECGVDPESDEAEDVVYQWLEDNIEDYLDAHQDVYKEILERYRDWAREKWEDHNAASYDDDLY
jgi:hypothetical protein